MNSNIFKKIKTQDKNTYFIITRSINNNTVVYSSHSSTQIPINTYWIMYEKNKDGEELETLTSLEYKLAYGYNLKSSPSETKFQINLNGLNKPDMIITCNKENNKAYIDYNGEKILTRIHIVCTTQLFGLYPKVIRAELYDENDNFIVHIDA